MLLKIRKPEMSRPFWVSFCAIYAIGFLALYGMLIAPEGWFDAESSAETFTAFKLSTARISVVAFSMFSYPILLITSLRLSKYFIISFTAWALAMYIDDHLVLYKIIAYPEKGVIALLLAIRPFGLLALLWMSFEIAFKLRFRGGETKW